MKAEVLLNAINATSRPKAALTADEVLAIIRAAYESCLRDSVFAKPIELTRPAACLFLLGSLDKYNIADDEELDDLKVILDSVIASVRARSTMSQGDWKVIKQFCLLPTRL